MTHATITAPVITASVPLLEPPGWALAERHWEGITAQLTELGMLRDEYERGYDWFHQGESRMGAGDTAVNLAAAGLVLNAWILTGDPRYRDWIEQYAGAWRERAASNRGVIPDNVGPDGVVGSLLGGRWYGGHYGWSWPHGWYSVGSAAAVAALAAATAVADDGYLDLVRPALDTMTENGKVMAYAESDSSLPSKWHPQLAEAVTAPTLLVPYRHSDRGWFDY
ncbi:MAG TPA: hypothetical protein VFX74_00265, partial [Candidatus Limnocylindria bacterium]|nr:hypothetical protein [Candidatus Limnocylindria bacterium]